jgi:hypothetical protein
MASSFPGATENVTLIDAQSRAGILPRTIGFGPSAFYFWRLQRRWLVEKVGFDGAINYKVSGIDGLRLSGSLSLDGPLRREFDSPVRAIAGN